MSAMLDKSLDDIVKESREQRGKGQSDNRKGQKEFSGRPRQSQRGSFRRRNGILARRDTADRRGGMTGIANRTITKNDGKFRRFNNFNNVRQFRRRAPQTGRDITIMQKSRNRSQNIVKVSDLDYSIMEEDLMELFSSVGDVLKVWIDYDRTDRSEGTGGCIFRNAHDAQRAIEMYNGCRIEGMPIHLNLLQNNTDPRGPEKCPW
ncbi:Rna recognition motif-containing protein [Cardiosporidium cionae]|uniref:Rna recognition motif-containing protein n=1 Tax=Cardiosporidium cionae TaxID=476202 RepID=A0ABQ7J5Y5_9APIC|nr:Rna recognition motif-containing protein [Cardiosporidium cionae]|eukprot:KAF8819375.1 Rna recognition motif-containing protein [Cardiosporidium cionae]